MCMSVFVRVCVYMSVRGLSWVLPHDFAVKRQSRMHSLLFGKLGAAVQGAPATADAVLLICSLPLVRFQC